MKKLDDFEEEYQVKERIVRIKSHLNAVGITATHIDVNTALMELVLLVNFKDNILRSTLLEHAWKRESYKPRPSTNEVGAQITYYARKDFLDYHLPREWEIAKDVEINPFKDVLVLRRMVEILGAIPINLKSNMWESEDLINNLINWNKPPKKGDGA
uniref:Uncharacterized protein n=1 Tax=Tanacetum cinerariifolium TaxID=118510 RepID=A0A6L2LY92_TANCI|nr:hypothetical protein [Tanacetum cinerariifolium]